LIAHRSGQTRVRAQFAGTFSGHQRRQRQVSDDHLPGRTQSELETASDKCVNGRKPGVEAQRALGIFGRDLRIVLRGRVELASLPIVIRDFDGCIVRQRTRWIIVPDVLEGFQGQFSRAEKRKPAVESGDPREFLVGGRLMIKLGHPELCDLVLASDKIVEIAGRRIFGVKAFEARERSEVPLLLILALGQVILGTLSPGRAATNCGDPCKLRLGLGESAETKQLGSAPAFSVESDVGRSLERMVCWLLHAGAGVDRTEPG
jgi:hypothetical protein